MMFRSLALYAVLGARRHSKPLGPVKSDQAAMLAVLNHHNTTHWPEVCTRHRLESSKQQAAISQSLTGLVGTLVSFQVKCIGTVSGSADSLSNSSSDASISTSRSRSGSSKHDSNSGAAGSCSTQASASTASHAAQLLNKTSSEPAGAAMVPAGVLAARQVRQKMDAACHRKDHPAVKRLFDPQMAQQADTPIALGMYTCLMKAHAALGEGPQAVALLKEMRAFRLPVSASVCSLVVLAFCKAGALQDALLHLQCTVPPHLVDTFMVNGILIAATQSNQPQLLILHQCLDILEERGLSWNATTWRQVFRLQAKANDMDGIARLKAQLDVSTFRNNPEVLTAYVRALCECNKLELASQALRHLLHLITPGHHIIPDSLLPPDTSPAEAGSAISPHADSHPAAFSDPGLRQPAAATCGQNRQHQQTAPVNRPGWRGWVEAALDDSNTPHNTSPSDTTTSGTADWLASALPSSSPGSSGQQDAPPQSVPQPQKASEAPPSAEQQHSPLQQSTHANGVSHSQHSQQLEERRLSNQQAATSGQGLQQPLDWPVAPRQQPFSKPLGRDPQGPVLGLSQYKLKLIREACHVVMTLAGRQGQHEMLLPLLESMQQAGVESDTAIQNVVMRMAEQQGQFPSQLEDYLVRLRRLGLRPDEQTFNILLRAYAAHDDLEAATGILDRMEADGVVAGRYTFNALLEGHSAAGNVRGAADVYDTMKDYGVKADHCTFIALFMAIKNQSEAARFQANSGVAEWLDRHQRHADREDSSQLLHDWVADMKAAGLKHTSPSLTALVQAYGHTMDFTRMVHLLRASWSAPNSAKPNLLTYNAAIAVCSRVGQLGRSLRLLHEMRASGIAPDVRTYTSLISACGFSREPRMAKQLWSEMQKQGIKPTQWTYTAKAKVESSVGAFEDALRTTQQMQAEGIMPGRGTWQVILSMAEQMERPDVVQQVHLQAGRNMSSDASAGLARKSVTATSADFASNKAAPLSVFDPEDMNADDLEEGGWSSGFDDSDEDDIIGGPF